MDDVHEMTATFGTGEEKTTEAIAIRRPTVADHLLSSRGAETSAAKDVALVRILSGLDQKKIQSMDMGDFLRAEAVVANFLAESPSPKS